jgi:hypothetical protein
VKLATVSITKRPIELLRSVESRYGFERPEPRTWHWRRECAFQDLPSECDVLVEGTKPFRLRWQTEGSKSPHDEASKPLAFGMHGVRIRSTQLSGNGQIEFELRSATTSDGKSRIRITNGKQKRKLVEGKHRSQTSAKNS